MKSLLKAGLPREIDCWEAQVCNFSVSVVDNPSSEEVGLGSCHAPRGVGLKVLFREQVEGLTFSQRGFTGNIIR